MLRFPLVILASFPALAAGAPQVVDLWPAGAPGSQGMAAKEVWVERGKGIVDRAVSSVHQPSLTVYLPAKEQATGAAVVIAPGGAYIHLAIDKEGHDVAKWLARIGVAGFVLKYRLPKTKEASYTIETALQDAQRALRLVRSRAKEWGVDPARVGIMGFSAGGDLAARAGTKFDAGAIASTDAVERESSRPDFIIGVYGAIPDDLTVTANTPAAFLVHADNDRLSSEKSVRFYLALKKAGVPAELHVYGKGGHGFGVREDGLPISSWPKRCQEWLENQGLLRPRAPAP